MRGIRRCPLDHAKCRATRWMVPAVDWLTKQGAVRSAGRAPVDFVVPGPDVALENTDGA
jgi:hypothetical protein